MAGQDELKAETLRVDLPLRAAPKPPDQTTKETVRMQLPVREATAKPPLISTPGSESIIPPGTSPISGPKSETARVAIVSNPLAFAGQIKNEQSSVTLSKSASANPSIAVEPAGKPSMLLFWVLLAISALILIIQIWTYLS